MKKSKNAFCILLALVMITCTMLSFAACNAKSQTDDSTSTALTETSEKPSSFDVTFPEETADPSEASSEEKETNEPADTTVSAETSGTTAKATAKSLGKVKVSDAYKKAYGKNQWGYKATVKIPKITIDGVSTKAINKEILDYCKKNSGNECSCGYSYYIGKTYVSILIVLQEEHDMSPATMYNVYNISRSSGKKLSKKSMLKTLGISAKKFKSRVKKAVTKYYKKDIGYSSKAPSYIKRDYKKAVSSKYLNKAIPYVNSKGKVSYMIKLLPIPAGAGAYDHCGTC